uniref:cytoskeleton-associated protein 2 isoform X2 n=1 Tax=Jaculus jaculus TaxID=51337 RepID=UPI001E1B5FED|nr:cytoskeleton-associated protein 2 isoform X2 [Jaculus jaculus]
MSSPTVPRDLQLPPSQRAQSAFKEQRRQKLKEHLLRRKSMFAYKQENEISSRGQKTMASENQVQEGTKVLKLKMKMADKENVKRPTDSKNNIIEKNCIPLKPNELSNSDTATEIPNFEDDNQTQLTIKDHSQSQNMTLSRAFHLKNNNKKKLTTAENPKQDANLPKKPVLGCYRGQIVQSKINSFRKPLQIKDESSATMKKLSAPCSKATKPQPPSTGSAGTSNMAASAKVASTKSVSTASQSNALVRPPIRSHHSDTQSGSKRGFARIPSTVTIRKELHAKELLRPKTVSSTVENSSQDIKRDKTLSRSISSEVAAKTASSSHSKPIQKFKTTDQRRHTIARTNTDVSAQLKETAEERKARLNEWRTSKGRVLKRPPNSVVPQPESEGQSEKPIGSFWTTMAEEDEQRLFSEKVNKTFSECLNLINQGCPKEEILGTLNDLIRNIPDAQKLVKYWICLVRIEPITSPIENIISIYEKAILAGAQPIEEMRHTIVEILTIKSQEKVNLGESVEEANATKEHIQELNTDDTSVILELEEMESEQCRNVEFQDGEKEHDKTRDPTSDITTPDSRTGAGCVIKYNVSTTPCLQSMKKKMQHDKINSAFKELRFLTPVRRSQRLQEKTSQLPDMLKDHYPCVSSLEQLSELGGDAFICRPNAALCPTISEINQAGEK